MHQCLTPILGVVALTLIATPELAAQETGAVRGAVARADNGFDLHLSARLMSGYPWASAIFVGTVPASQTVDLSLGYRVNRLARVHAIATNLFNEQRYQVFGGSVIGRRMLGGMTLTF